MGLTLAGYICRCANLGVPLSREPHTEAGKMSAALPNTRNREDELQIRVARQAEVAKRAIRDYNQTIRAETRPSGCLKHKKSIYVERAMAEYLQLLKELNQLRDQIEQRELGQQALLLPPASES